MTICRAHCHTSPTPAHGTDRGRLTLLCRNLSVVILRAAGSRSEYRNVALMPAFSSSWKSRDGKPEYIGLQGWWSTNRGQHSRQGHSLNLVETTSISGIFFFSQISMVPTFNYINCSFADLYAVPKDICLCPGDNNYCLISYLSSQVI